MLSFYRALAVGTMSIVAPIVATCAIVPVLWARCSTASAPARCSGSAMVAALAGVMLASNEPGREGRGPSAWRSSSRSSRRSASASALVFLDRAAEHDALTRRRRRPSRRHPDPARDRAAQQRARAPLSAWPTFAAIGLLDTGANTAFAIATTGGLLSLVAVLGGLFPVVTVALAYFILHERLRPIQRAGVLLALAGIPLISA